MTRFASLVRQVRRASRRSGSRSAVLPLSDSLGALGEQSWSEARLAEVPVKQIAGTVARVDDFDRAFRPRRRHLRNRWEKVAAGATVRGAFSPLQLVQLGELYFVVDGHHRVSVARANGIDVMDAVVRRVCTVAYACHCLTLLDLPNKTAERRFLERVPLPDDVRMWLWLDDPSDWALIEQAAYDWMAEHSGTTPPADMAVLKDLVEAWWKQDVLPSSHECDPNDTATLEGYLHAVRNRVADGAA